MLRQIFRSPETRAKVTGKAYISDVYILDDDVFPDKDDDRMCHEAILKCALPLASTLVNNGIDPDKLLNHTISELIADLDDQYAVHAVCG